ncbi:unnamed protein product [Anisakis simplex]|uniref:Coiled-coil domain-containing protein n=1 Tax=Anisakis simplex TaxID=6269 RepID=A0A0M3JXI8_ANISI|nr:unnamed protein product [Anisakis simplex]
MDSYNPLYDVHLRQYFASPHMQKHLRNLGLLQGDDSEDYCDENQLYARHHMMMDMMLRNRETQLAKLADIQKKLDAAEKIEICRKIRVSRRQFEYLQSGITSPETFRRAKPSRSLSRSRFSALNRKRRSSTSTDDKDLIKKIESDTAEPQDGDPNYVYNRLSASAGKFRYMHKLDDETLSAYMEQLRRQLDKLERFREVSFGPNSVAKHQTEPHLSWFFRRRSLPSLSDSEQANPLHEPLRY